MGPLRIRIMTFLALLLIEASYWKTGMGEHRVALTAALVLILLTNIWLIAYRRPEWGFFPYAFASVIIVGASALWSVYGNGGHGVIIFPLLWTLVWLLAGLPRKQLATSIGLAAFVVAAASLLNRNEPNLGNMVIGICGIYLGCRGITFVREGHRISIRHLAELDEAHSRLQKAHEELQEATMQSIRYAALSERTRLAREIHDGIGHRWTSMIIQLQAMEVMLAQDPQEVAGYVRSMLETSKQAMQEVRQAVRGWSEDQNDIGLTALKGLAHQTAVDSGLDVEFSAERDDLVTPDNCIVLFRVLQEALTNAMRHSLGTSVRIRLEEENGSAVLTVSDNGLFSENQPSPGFGMKGMNERCQAEGGSVSFERNLPHGLTVRAAVPMRRPRAAAPA